MALHFGATGSEAAWDAAGNILTGAAGPAAVYLVAYDVGKPIRGAAATGLLDVAGNALPDNNIVATSAGQYEFYGPGEVTDPSPTTKYILATSVGDWIVETTQMDEIVAGLLDRLTGTESAATTATAAANTASAAVAVLQAAVDGLSAKVSGLDDSHTALVAKAVTVRNGSAFGVGTVGADHPVLDETSIAPYDLVRVLTGASLGDSPFTGQTLYVDPNSTVATSAAAETDLTRKTKLETIAQYANARWVGDWLGDPTSYVSTHISQAQAASQMSVFVLYSIPVRDLGGYSGGGSTSADAYRLFVDRMCTAIGTARAVVVIEPDALPQISGLNETQRVERYDLLNYAGQKIAALANATGYLDAGHSNWVGVAEMADRLTTAGVAGCRGFALNTSNFQFTSDIVTYGNDLSARIGGQHYIIDTSRNGLGPPPPTGTDADYINPDGRALGDRPTSSTGNALVDALLWVKVIGESDGNRAGAPAAGEPYPDYAIGLLERAAWYVP